MYIRFSGPAFICIRQPEDQFAFWCIENPVRCMGVLQLEQELRFCKAKLATRGSTRYSVGDEKLIYKKIIMIHKN